MPEVNTDALYIALICLVLGGFAFLTYAFLERKRMGAEERRQEQQFTVQRPASPRVSWDGSQYDWTPEALAYLTDPYASRVPAPTAPQPALRETTLLLPPGHPSGPQPVPARWTPARQPAPLPPAPAAPEDDEFLARLRAENAEFLAKWAAVG